MPIPNAPTVTSGVKYHVWAANKLQAQPGVPPSPTGQIQRIQKVGTYRVDPDTSTGGLSGVPGNVGAFVTVWYDASDNTILVDNVSANAPVDDARDDAFSYAP
jgi:hypothetical protein